MLYKQLRYLDGEESQDFQCPCCGRWLGWDEDSLYPFTFETVACVHCEYEFQVKQIIRITYELRRLD
jgi:hypothetical protein